MQRANTIRNTIRNTPPNDFCRIASKYGPMAACDGRCGSNALCRMPALECNSDEEESDDSSVGLQRTPSLFSCGAGSDSDEEESSADKPSASVVLNCKPLTLSLCDPDSDVEEIDPETRQNTYSNGSVWIRSRTERRYLCNELKIRNAKVQSVDENQPSKKSRLSFPSDKEVEHVILYTYDGIPCKLFVQHEVLKTKAVLAKLAAKK